MIESEHIEILVLKFKEEDIGNFVSIIEKLLIASNQTGFKKPFSAEERDTIYGIADTIGLDIPDTNNIYADRDTIKDKE